MREQEKYLRDSLSNLKNKDNHRQLTSENLAWEIAEIADSKKAADIVILQLEDISYLADYFVIASGFSKTQVRALADAIEEKISEQYQKTPIRVEGKIEASWIVQDYGDVIVHLFLPQEREYYNLEAFWGHARRIEFSLSN
jgi:ribosome-associated protein